MTLPAKTILIVIGLWYSVKAVGLLMVSGASMASVEGITSGAETSQMIVRAIAPALAYVVAATVFGLLIVQDRDTAAIERALQMTFNVHLCWFGLCILYRMIAPFNPPLLSYYNSPGAQALRYAGLALPYLLLGVMLVAWVRGRPPVTLVESHALSTTDLDES